MPSSLMRRPFAHLKTAWRGGIDVVATNVRELVFLIGLVMVTSGLALVSIPAALIVPGVLLVWLAIPPRGTKA